MRRYFFILVSMMMIASPVWAAPVDVPTALKLGYGQETDEPINNFTDLDEVHFALSAEGDFVQERELEGGGEAEGMFYGGKLTFPLYLLGQWDWYAGIGMSQGTEIRANIAGTPVQYELDDGFYWNGGANYILYHDRERDWGIFADAKYRAIEKTDYDSFTAGGVGGAFSDNDDARWDEYQAALGLAKRFEKLLIYGGAKGSDTRIDADVTAGGTRYELDDAESDMMGGGFAGLSYQVNENLSMDVEGRMGDEMAYDGKVVVKF